VPPFKATALTAATALPHLSGMKRKPPQFTLEELAKLAGTSGGPWVPIDRNKMISAVQLHETPWGRIITVVTANPELGFLAGDDPWPGRPSQNKMAWNAFAAALMRIRPKGMRVADAIDFVADMTGIDKHTLSNITNGRSNGFKAWMKKRGPALKFAREQQRLGRLPPGEILIW
jgi:hypothetical protein